jgi:colicin import membrane protein
MNIRHTTIGALVTTATLLGAGLAAGAAQAALPKPTPAQEQAAADKKAKADAQAAKDKESLTASMDAVASHWRSRAGQQGWKTHPPVAIAAAAPAATAAPITGAAPAGQPAGQLTPTGAAAPIKSEKLGTAAPSADVKKAPTQAQPRNAKPTVDKGTRDVKNK